MGKVTFRGFRKPDDPVLKQRSIVLGGGSRRTSKKRSKQASSEKGLSQKGEVPGPKKEQ